MVVKLASQNLLVCLNDKTLARHMKLLEANNKEKDLPRRLIP
jgi:hypothetical protein